MCVAISFFLFHNCFYKLTKPWRTGFLFLLESTMTLNETVLFDHQNVISLLLIRSLCKQLVLVLCLYQVIETQFLTTGNQQSYYITLSWLFSYSSLIFIICFCIHCRCISGHLCIPFSARQILSTGGEYYFVKQRK